MEKNYSKYIKYIVIIGVAIFIICSLVKSPKTIEDFVNYLSYSITGTLFLSIAYVKLIWKWNPFEKTPRFNQKYHGHIEYNNSGVEEEKKIDIKIKQDLFTININATTDQNTSVTISSDLLYEHGQFVLYYTYITNPKSKYLEKNPIQYGTCRLVIDDINKISGKYWTTSKSIGDIHLTAF